MAQLSRLAKLFVKISDNLMEDDVRNLKALLSIEEILGKAKVEKATPLEIFDMLVDNKTIGKGNLGFLVQVLQSLGKGKLAEEAERLEQEQQIEGSEPQDVSDTDEPEDSGSEEDSTSDDSEPEYSTPKSITPDDSGSEYTTPEDSGPEKSTSKPNIPEDSGPEDSGPKSITPDDSESEETEVKETTTVLQPAGASASPDNQETTEMEEVTSELATLHIKDLTRLMEEPKNRTPQSGSHSATDIRSTKVKLDNLKAEMNTAAVMGDKVRQFDLCCQIGDLYRTKLHNLQSALQCYQNMMDISKSLAEYTKQAKAHNRLGLTYDILGIQQEAIRSHERALEIYKSTANNETELCIAYKNTASSLALAGQVSDSKTNYESALAVAMETGNKAEQMDIYCKLGDLHYFKLDEKQVLHKYYTEVLALARYLGRRDMEGEAYNRLGLACEAIGDNKAALEWQQKDLKVKQDEGDKKEEITAHVNLGHTYRRLCKVDQATSHFNTALQLAQQAGDEYGQMRVYFWMGEMQREQLRSPRTAIQCYEQHLALARQLGDRRQEGVTYSRVGLAHVEMVEYEAALEWYQKYLKISQEIADKKDEVTAHAAVGNAYRLLGKIEQATSYFDTALQLAQQTEDRHGQMYVYCNIGDLQREQLDSPRTAIQYYEQQLALARQLEERHEEGSAYNRLGLAHYEMGEYETAQECHHKDLKIRQENGDKITAHQCIAASYLAVGKLDQARSHYQSALTIAMETGNKQEQVDIYLRLGDLHRKQLHEPQASHKYYTEMLALAKDLGRKDKERLAYNRLGLACEDMQDNEAALVWHQKYLEMSQEDGDKTEQITAHKNTAASYQALGKLEQARSHYQSALTTAKETENKQEQEDIKKKIAELKNCSIM